MQYGYSLNDADIETLLYEYTGFPAFWRTGNPDLEFAQQLIDFFEMLEYGYTPCMRCGRAAADQVCDDCFPVL